MFTQFILGMIFIAIPMFFIFLLPMIQNRYNVENTFMSAVEDCEVLFIEEPRIGGTD